MILETSETNSVNVENILSDCTTNVLLTINKSICLCVHMR